MATTTPAYGWPVPTSTDYVKDGASAIESLGDAIDATLSGFLNVKQVVNVTYATQTSNSTTTYADTGLTASITPSSTNSKILVLVTQAEVTKSNGNANNAVGLRLLRGASTLTQLSASAAYTGTAIENRVTCSTVYLDSPATTSSTTYKTQFANNVAAAAVFVQTGSAASTITLIELEF
jgi:hypothetical protein